MSSCSVIGAMGSVRLIAGVNVMILITMVCMRFLCSVWLVMGVQ